MPQWDISNFNPPKLGFRFGHAKTIASITVVINIVCYSKIFCVPFQKWMHWFKLFLLQGWQCSKVVFPNNPNLATMNNQCTNKNWGPIPALLFKMDSFPLSHHTSDASITVVTDFDELLIRIFENTVFVRSGQVSVAFTCNSVSGGLSFALSWYHSRINRGADTLIILPTVAVWRMPCPPVRVWKVGSKVQETRRYDGFQYVKVCGIWVTTLPRRIF